MSLRRNTADGRPDSGPPAGCSATPSGLGKKWDVPARQHGRPREISNTVLHDRTCQFFREDQAMPSLKVVL